MSREYVTGWANAQGPSARCRPACTASAQRCDAARDTELIHHGLTCDFSALSGSIVVDTYKVNRSRKCLHSDNPEGKCGKVILEARVASRQLFSGGLCRLVPNNRKTWAY